MLKIIQDYKELRKARADVKSAKQNLKDYKYFVAERCNGIVFFHNVCKEEMFYSALPVIRKQTDLELLRKYAVECRATSCFYKIYENFGTVNYPFGLSRKYEINPGTVRSCINVNDNGTIDEVRCEGCSHFEKLVKYQLLNAKLKQAQENQKQAKQKLIDNFIFWKQEKEK